MQSLKTACEEGGSITACKCDKKSKFDDSCENSTVYLHSLSFKKLKTSHTSLPLQLDNNTTAVDTPIINPPFCIHQKLLELYEVESANDTNLLKTGLKRNSHLLEKLVAKERLNTLILNLYTGNKGYSLSFPTMPNSDKCTEDTADATETKMWPYKEEELLRYIDNEELPAFFVDLLEPHHSFLFYSGCIVVEVRDYRKTYPTIKCDIHHVLLKPTLQSVLADINGMIDDDEWEAEQKQQLESKILVANNPTLCLDPKSTLSTTVSRLNHNNNLLNTYRLRKTAKQHSEAAETLRTKLVDQTRTPEFEFFNFVARMRKKQTIDGGTVLPQTSESLLREQAQVPNMDPPQMNPPTDGVHIKEFKAYPRIAYTCDSYPQLVEEYVLETDIHSTQTNKIRVYHIKLSILQRPSSGEYLGELYLDRDHKKGESKGVKCRFSLGTRHHANKYVQQFAEIFTEGGSKKVRISHGINTELKERVAQVYATQMASQHNLQSDLVQQYLNQLNENLESQVCADEHLVNGNTNGDIQTPVPILDTIDKLLMYIRRKLQDVDDCDN